jgi:hypothetical protein
MFTKVCFFISYIVVFQNDETRGVVKIRGKKKKIDLFD